MQFFLRPGQRRAPSFFDLLDSWPFFFFDKSWFFVDNAPGICRGGSCFEAEARGLFFSGSLGFPVDFSFVWLPRC